MYDPAQPTYGDFYNRIYQRFLPQQQAQKSSPLYQGQTLGWHGGLI
jgi:hypothetical protein